MKKIYNLFLEYPPLFFLTAFVLSFFILWYVNEFRDPEGFKWHDIIVESNGLFFDLLVFGFLFSVYDHFRTQRERIVRYKEEIHDFRGVDSKEVAYRLAGMIRRLNSIKFSPMNLQRCFLAGTNLSNSDLSEADLSGANFHETDLTNSSLRNANLQTSHLFDANLKNADLSGANLSKANLTKAYLFGANLSGVNLSEAFLEKKFVNYDWFAQLESWQVKGWDIIKQTYHIETVGEYLVFKR